MAQDEKLSSRTKSPRMRPDATIAIVVSRYHEELTGAMLASAQRELLAAGARPANLRVVWVPGAFELPIVAYHAATYSDAVICLGVVIKGETQHDHWVAHGSITGMMLASLRTETPIHLGVLTCENVEQARSRALPPDLGGHEDKGREVARAAVETLSALAEIADWD